jgi:hypothetical protein
VTDNPRIAGPPPAPAPIACSLDAAQRPGRVDDWNRLLARVVEREPQGDGLRLHFPSEAGLAGEIATLAAAEQACCAFLEFSLHLNGAGIVLDVLAPAGSEEIVNALFGSAG